MNYQVKSLPVMILFLKSFDGDPFKGNIKCKGLSI